MADFDTDSKNSSESTHEQWLAHPTGSIEKGSFCRCCKRFNSRDTVVDLVIQAEGHVLLVFRARDPQAGSWALPGGYVDWDETVEEAAVREAAEEAGLSISVEDIAFVNYYSEPTGRQNVKLAFSTTIPRRIAIDDLSKQDTEVAKLKWWPIDDLPQLAFNHVTIVAQAISATA